MPQILAALRNVFDWYPAHYSPQERKLLRKLDYTLLIFASLSFFCKFLDQTNITNAWVSGLKEDLELQPNALNYLNVAYYSAYVVGQIPMMLLQTRPSIAAFFLPSLEIVWAILTFCQARVSKAWHLYLIRALIGFTEAPSFGATHFLLGSWYKNEELFKRAGTWFMGNALGQCFSGYLQAAAYKQLNGVNGLAGWRWLFIIDGVITAPIALVGFAFFPGLPSGRRRWFLSAEEHALATARLTNKPAAGKINFALLKRTLKMPIWWLMVFVYVFLIQSNYWTGYMALWLKSEAPKYSIPQINTLPTVTYIISAFSSWFGTSLSATLPPIFLFSIGALATTFSTIVLTIWSVPDALKFVAFYVGGFTGVLSPVLYSWLNTKMRHDPEARALTISSMMTFGYTSYSVIPIFTFPTIEAPRFPKGYPTSIAFALALWALFGFSYWYIGRQTTKAVEVEERATTPETPIDGDSDIEKKF